MFAKTGGLSFDTKAGRASLFGELTYRPNQPIGLNGTDLLNAFLSNTTPSLLRQDEINTPAGGLYHGFDRQRMLQLQVAAVRPFKNVLAADTVTLAGEAGIRRLPGLLAGADFIPTIGFGHDVKGWSHDGTFSEGRKTVSLSLRGEYQKRFFADLTYVAFSGGDYDELRDRDFVALAAGYGF